MAVKAICQISLTDITDAYSVILTSEAYTFMGNTSGAPSGLSCTTQVVVFCGSDSCSEVNIGTITCPAGISATISSNGTISPTITFETTATITTACEATIPVSVDGVTINKKFSFSVARQGQAGATGANGENAIRLKIYSPEGTIIKNNEGYVTLKAVGYDGTDEITAASVNLTDENGNLLTDENGAYLTTEPDSITYQWSVLTNVGYQDIQGATSSTLTVAADDVFDVAVYKCVMVYGNNEYEDTITIADIADGNGIKSTVITYKASTSGTTPPTGEWSTTIPAVDPDEFLWTRTVITYTDGTYSTSYSVGKMGATGPIGEAGPAGQDGIGIESTVISYQCGASGTTVPTGTWVSTIPETTPALPYLWTRTVITYTDNTTSTSYSVSSTLDGVDVGGRNLFKGTQLFDSDYWGDAVLTEWEKDNAYKQATVTSNIAIDPPGTVSTLTESQGFDFSDTSKTFTISCMVKGTADSQTIGITIDTDRVGYQPKSVQKDTWTKLTWTFAGSKTLQKFRFQGGSNISTDNPIYVAQIKCEYGNVATDWTPAPEDVDQTITDTANDIHQTIVDQRTSIISDCESILMQALESYVETGDFEEYQSTISTELAVLAGKIEFNFSTVIEQLNDVEGDAQSNFTEIFKYIHFDNGDIILGTSDSAITLTIEHDRISFKKNGTEFGWWDGVDFHTGNIIVDLDERAQFGNFAFVPRSDGSLSFLKVGE